MPKERFFNLPKEKQRRIVSAAVLEMSRVPFDEVSINQIIRSAGIPRGSFYQYFNDKEDVLCYILQGYRQTITQQLESYLKNGGNLLGMFSKALALTVEFGMQQKRIDFFKNVFTQLRLNDGCSFEVLQFNPGHLLEQFGGSLPLEGLRYTAKQDLYDILEMLIVLLRRAIVRIFADTSKKVEIQRSFDNQLNMITDGIMQSGRND